MVFGLVFWACAALSRLVPSAFPADEDLFAL